MDCCLLFMLDFDSMRVVRFSWVGLEPDMSG